MPELAEDHLLILALAKDALAAESSKLWGVNSEEACVRHGEACDRVWVELKRQLQIYSDVVALEPVIPSARQITQSLREQAVARLKERLPEMIAEAIGEFE